MDAYCPGSRDTPRTAGGSSPITTEDTALCSRSPPSSEGSLTDELSDARVSIARDPVPPQYSEELMVLEGMHYFNERVSCDLISVGSHFNPYQVNVNRIHKIPRIYVELLVSCASVHMAMSQDPATVHSSALMKRKHDLFNFRIRAIREVNYRLSKPETQTSDSTLMCVLGLLVATMQQSAYVDWRAHLEGARRIIQLRGGLKTIIENNIYFKPLMVVFIVIDVMAATTTPSTHKNMAVATSMALHYWEVTPDIFQSNLAISAPCPEQLFQSLILVNYLRSIMAKPHLKGRRQAGTRMVLEKIRSFDPEPWAARMKWFKGWKSTGNGVDFAQQAEPLQPSSLSAGGSPPLELVGQLVSVQGRDVWLEVGIIYRAAVLLYTIRTLILDIEEPKEYLFRRGKDENPALECLNSMEDVAALRLETRKVLAKAIEPIFLNEESARQLGKLVFFPVFVCGMEADDGGTELQDFVANGLQMLGRTLGTYGPIGAADELRRKWAAEVAVRVENGPGARITWDDYFRTRPDFIFGF